MRIPGEHIAIGRVLNEDADFLTLEVAKHDKVEFHLQQNEEGETVGGDRFLTMTFLRKSGTASQPEQGQPFETWLPWGEV